jgi:hypothetical protein
VGSGHLAGPLKSVTVEAFSAIGQLRRVETLRPLVELFSRAVRERLSRTLDRLPVPPIQTDPLFHHR